VQDSILKTWDSPSKSYIKLGSACEESNTTITAIEAATTQNKWNCFFIVTYVLFLLALAIKLSPNARFSMVMVAIVIAGLLDYVEDFFIALALRDHAAPAWHI